MSRRVLQEASHTRSLYLPPTFAWKVALVWDSSQRAEANCSCVVEGSAMLETTFSMQLWLHPAKNAHNPGQNFMHDLPMLSRARVEATESSCVWMKGLEQKQEI